MKQQILLLTICLATFFLTACGATAEPIPSPTASPTPTDATPTAPAATATSAPVADATTPTATPTEAIPTEAVPTSSPTPTVPAVKPVTTYSFPTVYSDIPDLDIIRVGENYYMVSTTMNMCPGAPIMKSTDLVHWEIVNYVYDSFVDDSYSRLENGKDMYSRGSWAASLRYNEETGLYYVAFNSNNHGFYVYTTDDIENGTWDKHFSTTGYHDPTLFFEGKSVYVISAAGEACNIQKLLLATSTHSISKLGASKQLFTSSDAWGLWEGAHAYKVGDYYYIILIASPSDRWLRSAVCYRSKDLLSSDWEEKIIFQGGCGGQGAGLAQGGIVDTQYGDWYGFLFQDRGGVGRVPSIVSVKWEDGWPIMGTYDNEGNFRPSYAEEDATVYLPTSERGNYIVAGDNFSYQAGESLQKVWQWNHAPKDEYWSVTEREGYLRLTTDTVVDNLFWAHNSLTQRTYGPACVSEVCLQTDNLKPGDYAGISSVSDHYAMIGVLCDENGDRYIFQANDNFKTAFDAPNEIVPQKLEPEQSVYLRIEYNFTNDSAMFYYSLDGENWGELGNPQRLSFSIDTTFMGTRSWLFCYATKEAGGYADFDYYLIYDTAEDRQAAYDTVIK